MATYVATTLGVIFSSVFLLIVTKKQIDKTFENERKREEILKYQKEKSILKLYRGAIKEIKDSVNNFLKWLNLLNQRDSQSFNIKNCSVYEIKYTCFANTFLFNIVEKDFEKSYEYIMEDELLDTIIQMLEKSKEVLSSINDDESDPMVNDGFQRMIKAEKRKNIEEEIKKDSENSIINILIRTEEAINKRLINIEKEIEILEKI